MKRDVNRVGDGVRVPPKMAARPTAPEAPGNPEQTRSARRDATLSRSDIPKPAQAPATDKSATAPRPMRDRPGMPLGSKAAMMSARPTAPPGAPTGNRRVPRWLEMTALAACLIVGTAGWWLYLSEVDNRVEMPIAAATRAGDDFAQVKQVLQQERDKAEKLGRELAMARREPRSPAGALTKASDAELRQALQQSEWLSATYQELLAKERARNQELEQRLDARRRDAAPGHGRSATANQSDTSNPTQAPATDKSETAPLPKSNKPVMPAGDRSPTTAARPKAPEAPGNPNASRLMARANVLLSQGDIGAARIVLERAAEAGSASALFALAETYDPAVLSAWRTFGTQGDVAKAQELYAKALVAGVPEAADRLNGLR